MADAVLCEELPRCGSGGLAAGIGAHIGIATPPLATFGTEAQQERWLAPAIRGEKIAALAITEPDAGSDVAAHPHARRARRRRLGRQRRQDVHHQRRARGLLRHRGADAAGAGPRLAVVPGDRPAGEGVTARPLEKLGWHASDTARDRVRGRCGAGDDALLGEEGRGFYLIVANFQWERLLMALGAVGSMRATLERVIAILGERGVLAERAPPRSRQLAARAEAGAALTYHALRRFLDGGDAVREVTMAKLATQRANFELQDACYGCSPTSGTRTRTTSSAPPRDARLGPIGGGTDEIMKEILGKTLGL